MVLAKCGHGLRGTALSSETLLSNQCATSYTVSVGKHLKHFKSAKPLAFILRAQRTLSTVIVTRRPSRTTRLSPLLLWCVVGPDLFRPFVSIFTGATVDPELRDHNPLFSCLKNRVFFSSFFWLRQKPAVVPDPEPISLDDGDTESIHSAFSMAQILLVAHPVLQSFRTDDGVDAFCPFRRIDLRDFLEVGPEIHCPVCQGLADPQGCGPDAVHLFAFPSELFGQFNASGRPGVVPHMP